MSDLYSVDKYRIEAESIVREHVIHCHSSLISDLAQSTDACEALGIDWEDELSPILSRYDYEEHARELIDRMDAGECWEWLDIQGALPEGHEEAPSEEPGAFDPVDELRAALVQYLEDEGDGWQSFCEDQRDEPDATEAYEHWHVSRWLGRRLEERGEMVGSLYGMTIWGRCTTGQGISLDGCILRIAKEEVDEREMRELADIQHKAYYSLRAALDEEQRETMRRDRSITAIVRGMGTMTVWQGEKQADSLDAWPRLRALVDLDSATLGDPLRTRWEEDEHGRRTLKSETDWGGRRA